VRRITVSEIDSLPSSAVTGLTPLRLLQIDRLLAQNMDDLLAIAHSPIASRLIDAILDTPAVPFKLARRVILNFIDSFFPLVDDRLGSRVGENIWSKCDGFLKVRRPLRVKSFACWCLSLTVVLLPPSAPDRRRSPSRSRRLKFRSPNRNTAASLAASST
jgi:hypothetical protein